MQPLLTLALVVFSAEGRLTPAELAARIDQHIDAGLKANKGVPAPPADPAELVRRLHLDLVGRGPDILAARDYIDSRKPDKASALITRLLADKRYALHWSNVWRNWLVAEAADQQLGFQLPTLEAALRQQLEANTPYDKMARSLIVADATRGGGFGTGAQVFYQANQFKAENLASATTRIFLGVKLECAQCHNHPFAKWERKQFWQVAAFFGGNVGIGARGFRGTPVAGTGEITIPDTDKKFKAKFLDGKDPPAVSDYRVALMDWMTAKDNPWFARAAVNRIWESLMGVGIVEPLDEESTENPPSHPELLDLLARQFAASDYDLKYLIQSIVLTKAYQRTSKQTHSSQADGRLFARQRVRGLTPEQLFDTLALVTGKGDYASTNPAMGFRPFDATSPRAEFLRRFPNQDKRSEQQTSILQALYLMNGRLVDEATSLEKNENLKVIAEATSLKTSRRVEQLFLIALNRKPTPAESSRLVKYVEEGGPTKDSARALCDVFWALLNSSEFCTNH
jgi:hypothetical protein